MKIVVLREYQWKGLLKWPFLARALFADIDTANFV